MTSTTELEPPILQPRVENPSDLAKIDKDREELHELQKVEPVKAVTQVADDTSGQQVLVSNQPEKIEITLTPAIEEQAKQLSWKDGLKWVVVFLKRVARMHSPKEV